MLSRTSFNTSETKYYVSIDEMPAIKWFKLCEKNDYIQLLISGNLNDSYNEAYDNIYSQIIDSFGVSDEYLKILKLKIRLEKIYNEIYADGKKWLQLQANMLEKEIEEIENKGDKQDIYMSFASIESNMNIKLDYNKITIREYYNYSKFIYEKHKRFENISKKVA